MYDDDKQIFEFIHNHWWKIWQWVCFYFKKIVKNTKVIKIAKSSLHIFEPKQPSVWY